MFFAARAVVLPPFHTAQRIGAATARDTIDFRVCGRADSVLSQIILDNTNAAEQIPKDARGRFITGDGTVFQGYLFDEGQL